MTYFLPERKPQAVAPYSGEMTGFGEGLLAATQSEWVQSNASWTRQRQANELRGQNLRTAIDRIGLGALNEAWIRENPGAEPAEDALDFFYRAGKEGEDMLRSMAADRFPDLALTDEAIEAIVDARMKAEFTEAEAKLGTMTPAGAGAARFIGGMVGATADIRNLPFLFAGGAPGSFVRVVAREALLNMAAEGITLPSRFDMAERLDIPDPDITDTLVMAALAGGALGGMVEGLRRGLSYYRGRGEVPEIRGLDQTTIREAVDAAEAAILRGQDPLEAVIRSMPDEAPLLLRDAPGIRIVTEAAEAGVEAPVPVRAPSAPEQAPSPVTTAPEQAAGATPVEAAVPAGVITEADIAPARTEGAIADIAAQEPAPRQLAPSEAPDSGAMPAPASARHEVRGEAPEAVTPDARTGAVPGAETGAVRDEFGRAPDDSWMAPKPRARIERVTPPPPKTEPAPSASGIAWVDDLASPDAQNAMRMMADDMRAQIETDGDFTIRIEDEDGNVATLNASTVLDQIENDQKLVDALNFCAIGGKAPE